MTRIALAAILSLSGNFCKAEEVTKPVSDPVIESAKWPNYNSSPWVFAGEEPLMVVMSLPLPMKNDYIVGSGKYDVNIGSSLAYYDSPTVPMNAVFEANILGGGSVIRILHSRSEQGVVARQIMVNGKWQDVDPEWRVTIEVLDPKALVSQGKLRGVVVRALDGEVERIKVFIENKQTVKSKK